jgi:hypothetical protein
MMALSGLKTLLETGRSSTEAEEPDLALRGRTHPLLAGRPVGLQALDVRVDAPEGQAGQ